MDFARPILVAWHLRRIFVFFPGAGRAAVGTGDANMKPVHACVLVVGAAILAPAIAVAQPPSPTEKLNAYVGCINRLSERSYESRNRYCSWAKKTGPTGKERIIYGTYTIYDTTDCKKNVEKANAAEPHDAERESAASAYADAVGKLEPLLKEA